MGKDLYGAPLVPEAKSEALLFAGRHDPLGRDCDLCEELHGAQASRSRAAASDVPDGRAPAGRECTPRRRPHAVAAGRPPLYFIRSLQIIVRQCGGRKE